MASQDWFEKDFYKILGVPKDADAAAANAHPNPIPTSAFFIPVPPCER